MRSVETQTTSAYYFIDFFRKFYMFIVTEIDCLKNKEKNKKNEISYE